MLLYTVRKSQNIEGLIINPFTAEPTVTVQADTFELWSDLIAHSTLEILPKDLFWG